MATATARPQLSHLTAVLDDLRAKGTFFKLRELDDIQAPVCTYDGRKVINLASNNYLGLCNHPKLEEAAIAAIKAHGVGSGAVRTIAGTMRIHMELEEQNRRIQKRRSLRRLPERLHRSTPAPSASLLGKEDFILSDELNHASIIDGARLSQSQNQSFPPQRCRPLPKSSSSPSKTSPARKLIITDGVFSMDGDIGPGRQTGPRSPKSTARS